MCVKKACLFGLKHYYTRLAFGSLAQSVEQLAFNQLVAGSNPARPTIIKEDAQRHPLFVCIVSAFF